MTEDELTLQQNQRAYQQTFLIPPVGQQVLTDLAALCHAHESTFDPDPRVHAFKEGQRHIWLHIARRLNLTEQQLWAIYARKAAR